MIEAVDPETHTRAVGDRGGIPWLYSNCGQCNCCLRGLENLCENAQFTGYSVDGGFAEYMVANESYVDPVPEGVLR
jgi:alcohol dehydrogenase, propanol-preferring